MAQHGRRYDRVAGSYSQYRPRYPDRPVAHLAGIIGTAPTVSSGSLVLDKDEGIGVGGLGDRLRPHDRARPDANDRHLGGQGGAEPAGEGPGAAADIADGHVRFGYLFQCITVRRDP